MENEQNIFAIVAVNLVLITQFSSKQKEQHINHEVTRKRKNNLGIEKQEAIVNNAPASRNE